MIRIHDRTIGAKPAQQTRSREKLEHLLGAMDDLLRTMPFANIRIADLAAGAGVSPASIYQRFSNRDALVAILIELYVRKIQEWSRSPDRQMLTQADSLHEALRRVGMQIWDMAEALGYVIGPAYVQSRLRPDLLGDTWDEIGENTRRGFLALVLSFPDELQGINPREAGDAISEFASMMVMAKILHRREPGSTLPRTREDYGDMIADFGCGFVKERAARVRAHETG